MQPSHRIPRRHRVAVALLASVLATSALASVASPAQAQNMNVAVSRLSVAPGSPDAIGGCEAGATLCGDDRAWRSVMTQLAGSMLPPILVPAGTRGVRGIYVGFETSFTGIDNGEEYWHRAVEGDGGDPDPRRSRFVDSVLAWGRFNVRKGLPFGFELGTNLSYLANTSYFALGLEIRWALFEGFRVDAGWIPDVAVRAAVQTLIGDGEFNLTVPSLDFVLSEPFVVANSVEIIPSIYGQVAWVFADSELVDLSPATGAFSDCMPDPRTPPNTDPGLETPPFPSSPPHCRGGGSELNQNVVFPSLRSTRFRLGGGLSIRYEWFTLIGSFLFDVLKPSDLDGTLPVDLPRQWQANVGVGLTF